MKLIVYYVVPEDQKKKVKQKFDHYVRNKFTVYQRS
jgi:hypothetical protein